MKLDLGCGNNKRAEFIGVDIRKFDAADLVCDLSKETWNFPLDPKTLQHLPMAVESGPWYTLSDDSVDEAHCSHFVEHLDAMERVAFVNELHRVMKVGAKATLIVPHWSSCRAYGDLTHRWPPVSEFWFYYLLKSWREVNAPHNDFYTCDFDAAWGSILHPEMANRNAEYVNHAMKFWKEATQDLICTLTKR